ncbi:CDGSH iron-sulfur domain-containing protein [Nocardioides bizhenqiangii]|uniref:CDGSH iron-sulfur domain-containing protein n=1 Tax=Nocardioides bizhenqiangii TaxID=3095076 RepID=A0ABZ0ZVT9_9ACTN|nr:MULTISPECIES: CDGSH iron-sulfur domain-containing protein [unclassified Nocardioides]MDZ5622409.1 CDGSH iron-sulfur domain-containing protein [Nocardioides sp. HM23]WQQ28423.1 CDGSH iron-sulfur domain-containing protein [Nocardioides sp. HM61]
MNECQVTVIPDGPALIRGADRILDDEGRAHEVERPVVAVCLCGLTQRPPWCDATHKVAQ